MRRQPVYVLGETPDAPRTVLIPITRGLFATVDEADMPMLRDRVWSAYGVLPWRYACCSVVVNGVKTRIGMHRLLLGALPGQIVDHANGDTLDNRRCNLRFATAKQNSANCRSPGSLTGFRGVRFGNKSKRYVARIKDFNRQVHLGTFDTPEQAAKAYDAAAAALFGDFAVLNFPRLVHAAHPLARARESGGSRHPGVSP